MKQVWMSLHPIARGIIAVAAVGTTMYVGYKAYKYFSAADDRGDLKAENKDAAKDLKTLMQSGVKATYMDSQYTTWANQLKEAFDGCGTSNGTWRSIYGQMKNDVDVLKLQDAYGTRTFDECNWEGNFGDFEGTLSQAIVHELSTNEQSELNKLLETAKISIRY